MSERPKSKYTPYSAGVGELLRSDMLLDVVDRVAETIMERAISLSPIGTPLEGDTHPGEYITHWRRRSHRDGGATGDRVEAIVYNDAADALWVEFGHHGREPYHVLKRAAFDADVTI